MIKMIEKIGKEDISAKVVAHSISPDGVEIITYELEYPRFIHSEMNTHRVLSKNAASSRAIPIKDMIALIDTSPAIPVYWGKNKAGMTAKEQLTELGIAAARAVWISASKVAISVVSVLDNLGLHKQISNRLLEPWARIKVVVTGTEWNNFFYLRNHEDAQPEICELARVMIEAENASNPTLLKPGEWHLPYVFSRRDENGDILYYTETEDEDCSNKKTNTVYSLKDAQKISMSCCAQVSYRKNDDSVEKAEKIYGMLNIGSKEKPQHASPLEHQATPMDSQYHNIEDDWQDGITHMTRDGRLWSGNFVGFVQYRQLVN